jgi:diguanylate cyclase (GGDEF)-like protein
VNEGIGFLTERVNAAERERDDLLERSQRLETLQRSFVDIVAAGNERALAVATMRGAWLGLGFSRALWFRAELPEPTALYEIDGEGVIDSEYGGTLPETSTLFRVLYNDSEIVTGWAGDSDAPLFDTRRRYAAAAITPSTGDSYVLYVDGSNERSGSSWTLSSLQELATHAAFALERMRMAAELERLAMRDPLTGLPNRRSLMERLTTELATARRTKEPLAFAMVDVDNFKSINDTRGHAGGDEALTVIASILQSNTRETDIAARFAGDEFSLLMPRTDGETIEVAMTRIYAKLKEANLGCSIGIAFARLGEEAAALMARADAAVYEAKAAGKNCYRLT